MNALKEYVSDKKAEIGLLSLFLLVCHGSRLFSDVISIDTEIVMTEAGWEYQNWMEIGRPSLVFLKWIAGLLQYNPYLVSALTLLFLLGACVLFGFFCDDICIKCGGLKQTGCLLAMGVVIISSPIITEQLSFNLQSAEIAFCFMTAAAAAWFSVRGAVYGKKMDFMIAAAAALLSFFAYQSFVFVYIVMVIQYLFLLYFGKRCKGEYFESKPVWKCMGFFVIVFAVYEVLQKIWFSGSGYLDSNNYWGVSSVRENIARILRAILSYFMGESIFHTPYISVVWIVIALLTFSLMRGEGRRIFGGGLLPLLGMLLSPFLMFFALGGPPQSYRAELDVVFAEGALVYSALVLCENRKMTVRLERIRTSLTVIAVLAVILIGWKQMNITTRLYYTDELCYENDVQMGYQVAREVNEIQGQNLQTYPVFISGKYRYQGNSSCLAGEQMGKSFFGWVDGVYWHNKRSLRFLETLGFAYTPLEEEKAIAVSESGIADDMPVWPQEGSIALREGIVVIKLGE